MIFRNKLKGKKIILASNSPRRQALLKELCSEFEIRVKSNIDESFPTDLIREEIPLYLSRKKANAYKDELTEDEILITADTIVWLDEKVVNKPTNRADAIEMIHRLSGNMHEVATGVCLTQKNDQRCFYALTKVYFRELMMDEIEYYVDQYKPYDKAGAYGIQEWIGYVGITKIEGSYFNVMGLPVQKLYDELQKI